MSGVLSEAGNNEWSGRTMEPGYTARIVYRMLCRQSSYFVILVMPCPVWCIFVTTTPVDYLT